MHPLEEVTQVWSTSALPPKADIRRAVVKRPLLTHSGHSLDRVIQPVGTENQEMLYAFLGTS